MIADNLTKLLSSIVFKKFVKYLSLSKNGKKNRAKIDTKKDRKANKLVVQCANNSHV